MDFTKTDGVEIWVFRNGKSNGKNRWSEFENLNPPNPSFFKGGVRGFPKEGGREF